MSLDNPHKAYTQEDVKKAKRIVAWLDKSELNTQAELSKASNSAPATISQALNGKYISSPSKLLDAMIAAISRKSARKVDRSQIPFVETGISKALTMLCNRAHNDRDFGFFAGNVGIGKTQALRHYLKNNSGAILVEAFEGIDNRTFIAELAAAMGQGQLRGTVSQQTSLLIRLLKGSDRVIAVDEANHLPPKSLGALRRISDVAEIGVILVGTPELLQMVQDPAGRFGQISSRIGFWADVVPSIEKKDSDLLVQSYFQKTAIDSDILEAFWQSCEGSARTLRNILRNTYRNASKNKVEITADLIKTITTETMSGRGFTTRRT